MSVSLPNPLVRKARPVTGKVVLLWLLAFFGTILAANAALVHYAVSTLSGVDTPSAYKAGLAFENDIHAAERQVSLGWRVDEHVQRLSDGRVLIRVEPHDSAGRALEGLTVQASLHHPADARRDRHVALVESQPGIYSAADDAAAGGWELVVDLTQGSQRMYRSENRLVLP